MADIDALFKKPTLPSTASSSAAGGSRKRKNGPHHDPVAAYKAAKFSNNSSPDRTARVEDAPDTDDYEGGASSSALPADFFDAPSGAAVDEPDEDEDGGRFFGGGVSEKQAEIFDFVDELEKEVKAPETIDVAWLRKKALGFEKKINKNAELRAKFDDEPQKFMESEEQLDTEIKSFSILSSHPSLYPEFIRLGTVTSLVRLLSHENTDIATDVVELLSELTDEDIEATPEQWSDFIDTLMSASLPELLTQNLTRLNETLESDRAGIYHTLSLFENLCSQPSIPDQLTSLLPWLLTRIQARESPVSQNKQYSAELLSILLQTSPTNRRSLISLNAIDTLLQLLFPYRKHDPPKHTDEAEFVENLFDVLTLLVDEPEGQQALVDAEGIELLLIMLKDGKMAKMRALRLIDHALTPSASSSSSSSSYASVIAVATRLVTAGGLKHLFTLFMRSTTPTSSRTTLEHLLSILSHLLRLLPSDSPERIRTLAKFVEKDYEKITRLLSVRKDYVRRLRKTEEEIDEIRRVMDEDTREEVEEEWVQRRLEGGGYVVAMLDQVLAWLWVEDKGARERVRSGLEGEGGVGVVRKTLEETISLMGDSDDDLDENQKDTKDMLETLISFL
ncbi:DUF1716-domain-containing protein [Ascodesmis nigricans]|uniref:DUF1716-domain-containing protein n=1 Tax=Ascodesmis nigricans TaxID=341454 RepID=A0A4S2N305_9PEZI|nr:DUF1716-domain-containing protein [Ascodesmis nigricans]